ncbi:glycosyltransferase family 2 protein [Stratiformator vulcanicus]|uniref:Glycosyltransferase EpsE n=1 Tax=Stratiformator vulcanicus TaxID=2527980 RepID=A0A517QW83_9PLAN|nr:glycosyltransferase family 2 protein [Stratiformator vulcanicus]QDT35901.1 Putative glycosyltransferase EpsE [Stratiformator vulcanicus]
MSAVAPITIGMPIYNAERYLEESLESLLGQTCGDFELIISDNGSSDRTEEICRQYAADDSRITYIQHDRNRGAVWNFNHVFERSRSPFFKWASYDDVCRPTFLEACYEPIQSDDDIAWVHPLTNHLSEDGIVQSGSDDPEVPSGRDSHSLLSDATLKSDYSRQSLHPRDRFAAVVLGTTWCSDSYGLMRAAAVKRTRLYLPCYGAEKVLLAELSLVGRFAEVEEPLFLQRVHDAASGSLTSASAQAKFIAPSAARRFSSTRFTLLHGFATAIKRSDLGLSTKVGCYRVLGQYMFQVRKWSRVLSQMAGGRGMALPKAAKGQRTTDVLQTTSS